MKAVRESVLGIIVMLVGCLPGTAGAQTVAFPDPNLEAAVRSALFLTNGPITQSNMAQLVWLPACCLNITNLAGLETATNLTSVDLSHNRIHDLSPLAGLTKLTYFNAGGNQITNINALSGMTQLSGLWLYANPLRSLAPISNLTALASLALYNSSVTNITPLAALTNLEYLELRWNPLAEAQTILSGLTNLQTLYLGGTSLTNTAFLQNLTRLTDLYLDHNKISDISPLTALPLLTSLDVGYNPLPNPEQIASFINLTNLFFSGHSVSNAAPFASLNGLSVLMLISNRIDDLSPLSQLSNLRELGVGWNPVTNHAPIAALNNLVFLQMDGHAVSNLSFLQQSTALKALSVQQNRLQDLDDLGGLMGLVAVFADFNRLTGIASLENKLELTRARLKGNLLDLNPGSPAMETVEALLTRGVDLDLLPQNEPPLVIAPFSWNIATNSTSQLRFEVYDDASPIPPLITASSSNTNLISEANLVVNSTGVNRTLTATPEPDQSGSTTITLTVTDHSGLSASVEVLVNVVIPQTVSIPDPGLEFAIRTALNKLTGPLTSLDLESLIFLNSDEEYPVNNLAGLNAATNLAWLQLKGEGIEDFTPLQSLDHLEFLVVSDNPGADFSPLAGLTNLTTLVLTGNAITNLDFISQLTGLQSLTVDGNSITDLSPLTALTGLHSLSFHENLVTEISPLLNLPALAFVDMRWNVLNLEIDPGPITVIETLNNNDVETIYNPQRGPPEIDAPDQIILMTNAATLASFSVSANAISENVGISVASSDPNLVPNEQILVSHLSDQWKLLTITPGADQAGDTILTLTVTNDLGFISQKEIWLVVTPPQPFDSAALNSTLTWQTGGGLWVPQVDVSHDGFAAAQTWFLGDGGQSWLETTLEGPGVLTFWWKVSSEEEYDTLQFELNGVPQPDPISGDVDWQQRTVVLYPGTYTARWLYSKDLLGGSHGSDAAWLDEVQFTSKSVLDITGLSASGEAHLLLYPLPGKMHSVLASTNLSTWSSLGTFFPTNSVMPFVDTNATPPRRFYRLEELPE